MKDQRKTKKELMEELIGLRSKIEGLENFRKKIEREQNWDRSLFENSRDAVVITSREGKFVDVNQAALELFGYTREEMTGMNVREIYMDYAERTRFQHEIEVKKSVRDYKIKFSRKDGKVMDCLLTMTVREANGGIFGYQGIIRDVSGEKQARGLYKTIANASHVGVYVAVNRKFEFVNPHILEYTGYSREEMLGKDPASFIHPDDKQIARENALKMLKGERQAPFEYRLVTKDGRVIWILGTLTPINYFGERAILGNSVNITEEKEARTKLEEAEAFESSLLDAIPHAVIGIENRQIIFANNSVETVFGWKPEELEGKSTRIFYQSDEDYEEIGKHFYPALETESTYLEEFPCRHKDGEYLICRVSASRVGEKLKQQRIVVVYEDITREKQAQKRFEEVKALESSILDAIPHAVLGVENRQIFFANDSVETVFGWKPEELIGKSSKMLYRSLEEWKEIGRHFYPVLAGARAYSENFYCRRKDKKDIICKVSTARVGAELKERRIVAVYEDITEQKKAEAAFKESQKKYSTVVEQAIDGIIVIQDDILTFANQAMANMTGFSVEELTGMPFMKILVHAYRELVYERYKRRMAGEEITPVYEAKIRCKDGTHKHVEIAFGVITMEGKPADMGHIRDVTVRKKAQEDLKKTVDRLQKRLEETVNALASVTEKRDPYTSGHQNRVTILACAIAREMGLPQEKIEAIRVAATLHDIGKVYEPAELLSKPSVLTDVEFLMMKLHPEIGYDILKNIEFPWPVAEIVRQHHEKLDGSGYPDGLKGKEILIEARVLTVADVVEAMSSHRPYRPALGIEVALDEISKHRGMFYDPDVVDACLRLFNEKGFDINFFCSENSKLKEISM